MKYIIIFLFITALLFSCSKEVKEIKGLNGQSLEKYEVAESSDGSIFKDGFYKLWYTNGQIHIDCNYKENKKDGNYIEYYKNGIVLKEGKYENDVREGEWTYNHPNGKLKQILQTKKGNAVGAGEIFDENGTKRVEGNYIDGNNDGLFKYYDKDRKLTHTRIFKNDIDITLVGKWKLDNEEQETMTYELDGTCTIESKSKPVTYNYELNDNKLKVGNNTFTIKTLTDSSYTVVKNSYFDQQVFNGKKVK